MVKRWLIVLLTVLPLMGTAQEVLLPLQRALVAPVRVAKDATGAVALPFFDDFAAGTRDGALWQSGGGVMLTQDISPLAPTVGVATLDALDGEGNLYGHAATSLFNADTLTSLPLQLAGLTTADSVVLSFFYLPGGGWGNMWERVGDTPDGQDSLFVDFFSAADSAWVTVWSRDGVCVDTLMARTGEAWQYVALPLDRPEWFDSTFRFRFRSYASLESSPKASRVGNCDFWHVDYVMVDRGRDATAQPSFRDVAFAAPAPTLLRDYRAMPFRQYSGAQDLAPNLDIKIINRYRSPLAMQYSYSVEDAAGTEVYNYDGGFENAPPQELQTIAAHCHPAGVSAFAPMTATTDYTVVHVVREGTGGDAYPLNDTVRYRQHFGEYYAYDDGSPENGYGLTSTASQLFLAYRFDLNRADTLTAVDLYFNRTLDDANGAIPFYLTLWSVGDDGRPDEVIYSDQERRTAAFGGYRRYVLEAPVVVEGSLFVGFEQTGNEYINLGFDRSYNTAERIYYLTGTEWQQSILSGSLMLRPCFGVAATVGMDERPEEDGRWTVYPNPASERVFIDGVAEGSRVQLYDMQGRRLLDSQARSIDVALFPDGLYLLRAIDGRGEAHATKLIVKH